MKRPAGRACLHFHQGPAGPRPPRMMPAIIPRFVTKRFCCSPAPVPNARLAGVSSGADGTGPGEPRTAMLSCTRSSALMRTTAFR